MQTLKCEFFQCCIGLEEITQSDCTNFSNTTICRKQLLMKTTNNNKQCLNDKNDSNQEWSMFY